MLPLLAASSLSQRLTRHQQLLLQFRPEALIRDGCLSPALIVQPVISGDG